MRFTAADKDLIFFDDCNGRGRFYGASGSVLDCNRFEVDVCETMGLDCVLDMVLLGKVNG